jgi:hypothetical protein
MEEDDDDDDELSDNLFQLLKFYCGPGNVVGIVTGYGLDGPEIEFRWGRDSPQLPRPALGSTQTPVQ